MCYVQPGPRCSGHTRTIYRAAKANLAAATEDLREKTEALKGAKSVEAQTALQASEKAHAQAVAELEEAEGKYQVSKENRAVAMEAYREAQAEYFASPEGIEMNRQKAENPKLSKEKRKEASQAAMEGSLTRKDRLDAWKAEQAKDEEATEALKSQLAGLKDDDARAHRLARLAMNSDVRPAEAHTMYEQLRDGDQDNSDVRTGYQHIAGNTALPAADLIELASSRDAYVRYGVAGNPNLPKAQRDEMLKDDEEIVRRSAIAASTKLNKAQVQRLFNDKDSTVRATLVSKFNLDEEKEFSVCRSNVPHERASLASNPYLGNESEETLSTDPNQNVRRNLLSNPSVSTSTIQKLANDHDGEIRAEAILTGRLSADEVDNRLTDPSESVRVAVATKTTSPAILSHLANDQNPKVRAQAARHADISADDLSSLAGDTDSGVSFAAKSRMRATNSAEKDRKMTEERNFIQSVRPTEMKALRRWRKSIDDRFDELRDDGVGGVTHHELELGMARSWARNRR